MRKLLALAVLAAVALTGPVLAGGAQRQGRIDTQTFIWTNDEATTSSTEWEDVPGLAELSPSNCFTGSNRVSALASLWLEGSGPVGIRVATRGATLIGEEPTLMKPGAVTADLSPVGERAALSFNFVHGNPPSSHGTTYSVQWRSPSGSPVTMHKGTLNVIWDFQKGICI